MASASTSPWPALFSLLTNVAILVVSIRFHRLCDRDVFAGDAGRVFSRPLAAAYLCGVVLFWVASLVGLTFLIVTGRRSWQTSNTAAVLAGAVLMLGYIAVVWTVQIRAQNASLTPAGPVARLAQFVRLGYGTAAPAAWRRLRSPS